MTIIHLSPKLTWRWAFCAVTIVLALGLMWLALEEGRKHPREISGDSTSPSAINLLHNVSPNSKDITLLGWELGLRPASLESTSDKTSMAGAYEDNATALALGSAGAATLVGLVLFLAWKFRHSSPTGFKDQSPQWARLMRRAPSV